MPHTTPSRRNFLQGAACAGLGAAVSTLGCTGSRRTQAAKQKHPNLLFIFADQMRAQAMGCMGHPTVRTPNLDAMARNGMLFENAVSNCPVCTPYRASLLSGRYPLSTGMFMNDLRMPTDIPTFGTLFRDAGYHSGYIGKWHLDGPTRGGFTPPGPRRQGFDDFWAVANCNHNYMKAYLYRETSEPIWLKGYEADVHTDLALEFLEGAPAGQPFCLFVSWAPPHNPYNLMPDEYRVYSADDVQPRPNCPEPPLEDLAGYYAHITALDRDLGRIMTTLEQRGLLDETVVVFTSDHGDMLGSHRQQRKQRPWDESVLVPMLVQQPGRIPAGQRSRAMVNTQDFMPTLLTLCGLDIPGGVEGSDLSRVWTGRTKRGPNSAFLADYVSFSEARDLPEWRGVRTDRYSFISTIDGPWMLFDNQKDPYQLRNILHEPEGRATRRKLERELDGWLDRTSDTFMGPEDYLARFGYEVDKRGGHIPHTSTVGVHDL